MVVLVKLFPGETGFSLNLTRSNYREWVNERTNLVFRDPDGQIRQFLSPKRGNYAYKMRVNKRFTALAYSIEGTSIRHSEYTSLLYITCTLKQAGLSLIEAWETIGLRWNNFITKLRRQYGQIDIIRCFEAHEKGFPHIHALLFMPFHSMFELYRSNITGKKSYRLVDKTLRNDIKSKWSYHHESLGFMDVQCIINVKYGLGYIFKYILKSNDFTEKSTFRSKVNNALLKNVTNFALLWRFSKRAYACSRAFLDLTRERLHISNPATAGLVIISSNYTPKWEFLGLNTVNGFVPKENFRIMRESIYRKSRFCEMVYKVKQKLADDARIEQAKALNADYARYLLWL